MILSDIVAVVNEPWVAAAIISFSKSKSCTDIAVGFLQD